jgi:hypothetical protein
MTDGTIDGDISFAVSSADGDDTLDLSGGTITGDVSFGYGANALNISGGTLSGIVNATGGTLDISVDSGTLRTTSTTATTLERCGGTLMVLGNEAFVGIIYTSAL